MNTPSLDIVGTDAYGSHQVGAQKAVYGKTGGSFSLAAGKTNLGHLEGRGFMVDGTWCFDTSSRFLKDLKLPSMAGLVSLGSLVLNMSNFVRYFVHWHLIFIIFEIKAHNLSQVPSGKHTNN